MILSYVCRRGDPERSLELRRLVGARNHWTEEEMLEKLRGIGLVMERRHVLSERDTDRHLVLSLRWTSG